MRRKSILIIFVIFIISGLMYGEIFIGLNGKMLAPSDKDYKDIYGNSVYYPEIEMGINIYKGIMLIGDYGFFTKEGKTIGELEAGTKSSQNIISMGIGYRIYEGEKLMMILKGGISDISYKEEAMGESVKGSGVGMMLGGDILYKISDRFYTKGIIRYERAKDTVEGTEIKLGGISVGIGAGVRF